TRKIWAVWQPHTYSRTQALWDGYVSSFGAADHVIVTEIFAAREDPVPGVNSADLAQAINHPDVHYSPTFDEAVEYLLKNVQPPAAILIMSAGDAPLIGLNYLKLRQGKTDGEAAGQTG